MKTPLKKGSFRNFFINYGYVFLIVPFLSYLLWYYPLNAINEVRNDEQINFFITGYTFNDDSLENDIHSLLKDDGCYEVNIHCYSPKDNYLVSYYERFGEESDFIFLYESDLNEMFKDALEGVTSSFLPWSNKIKEDAKSKNSVDALDQENIDAKQIEKKKNQQKELDRYRNSPIVRFRESLNKFIKNEVQFNRESTWRKYNKKYGEIGVLRPGKTNVMSPVPLINVYVDRSGSWDASKTEEGIKAIATLNKYVRQGLIKVKLYYFSEEVHQEEQDAINEGGTEGQPILNHIAKTKPTNVIIMTDSDIDDCRTNTTVPGGVWLLFYGGRSQNLIDHLQGKMMTRIFDMQ